MKYKIFTSAQEFEEKNTEIFESGVCGNAKEYSDIASCKHPQLDQWAMPVLEYAEPFFDANELSLELSGDWITPLKKNK